MNRMAFLKEHTETLTVPDNATPHSVIEDFPAFLQNYVEENAIVLPGRIAGFKSDEVRVLSSSESKMNVWHVYYSTCEVSNKQAVSYKKFTQLRQEFFPDVVVAKPMTDLCFTCQQNSSKLQRAANLSESEKWECIATQQEHLNSAKTERDFYKFVCNKSKETLETIRAEALQNRENVTASSLAGSVN